MGSANRWVAVLLAVLVVAGCGPTPVDGGTDITPLPIGSAPPDASLGSGVDRTSSTSPPSHGSPQPPPGSPPLPGLPSGEGAEPSDPGTEPERRTDDGRDGPAVVPVDITVVPDTITEAYVDAVFVELERLFFEALLILRTEGELTVEVTDRLGSVLTERHYLLRLREFLGFVDDDFPGMHGAEDLQPRIRKVVELLDIAPDCIYAETTTDYAGFSAIPPVDERSFVVLWLSDDSRHVNLNASPWVYTQIARGDHERLRGERPC